MNKLKNEITDVINSVNQNWVNEIKEAQKKNEGIDVTNVMGKYSEELKKVEKAFIEFQERSKNNKRGIF
jgi:hypothetical protein